MKVNQPMKNCTCSEHGWYGAGHSSACAITIERELRKQLANTRKNLRRYENKASAKLNAAAPDLLAALKHAGVAIAYYDEREGASGLVAEVKAAITKATT